MAEPMPDYSDDEDDDVRQQDKEQLKQELMNIAEFGEVFIHWCGKRSKGFRTILQNG